MAQTAPLDSYMTALPASASKAEHSPFVKSQLMPFLPTAGSAGQAGGDDVTYYSTGLNRVMDAKNVHFSSGLQAVEVCAEAGSAVAKAT